MHIMIAGHDSHTTRQSDHRLVRQEDLLHHLLLVGITAATIAQVMLRAGAHALLQVALLETIYKSRSHHGREVTVLTVRLFQTVETGRTTHIHHG